jgi:ATP-dependent DNA helicase RecQ
METRKNKVIQDYEKALARVILYGIQELPFSYGIQKVTRFLRGTKSSFVINKELYQLDMYGVLPNFRVEYLRVIIDKLLKQGFLIIEMVSDYENFPTLVVTKKGEDFLEGRDTSNIEFVYELSDREVILLNEEEQILYESLKQLRQKISTENEIPAYVVCHNTHLREMAKSKPKSDNELLSIRGIGESFVQKYGSDFLSVIRAFVG